MMINSRVWVTMFKQEEKINLMNEDTFFRQQNHHRQLKQMQN